VCPPLSLRHVKLLLTYSKYLGPAVGAYPPGGRLAVLHLDLLGVLDLHFLPALHTIRLHPYLLRHSGVARY